MGPAPTDPVVYEASAETTRDVGIVRWGHATDANDDATIFRGYGSKNELLVEIRQTLTQQGTYTKTFEMKMTGAAGSGSQRIDFVAEWEADGKTMDYVTHVRENTFAAGSPAAKILARLAPDAAAMVAARAKKPTGTLAKNLRPLDAVPGETTKPEEKLVEPTEEPLIECCSQLTNEETASAAAAGTECPLVEPTGEGLTSGAGTQGVDLDLEEGGGIGPRALELGKDKQPVVKSPWAGKYNIVDHHCHNAAQQNSSKTDGYIGCVGESSTTKTQGHTINWAPDPTKPKTAGAFCAYEPQSNGGTSSSNSVCCWEGTAAKDGAPSFDGAAAQACVTKLCLGQANFKGTAPKAYAAGSSPPVPNDCPGTTADKAACTTCCTAQADNVNSLFGDKEKYKKQITEYRDRCAVACVDRDKLRKAVQKAAAKCLASLGEWIDDKLDAMRSCQPPPKK